MTIDLNADLGEGAGNDALLMPYLSSCNIACGAHAGDEETIQRTVVLALQNKVKIGAHPSFPDRQHFGRLPMEIPEEELKKTITDQITRIKNSVENEGSKLHHVKPHGALYTMAATREDIARTIVNVLKEFTLIILYAPFGSVISNIAKSEGIQVHFEVFADRNYNDDLTLVSRTGKHAILQGPNQIALHVLQMIREGTVKTISGNHQSIKADTVCIHGDNPNAVTIVKALRLKLNEAGIELP